MAKGHRSQIKRERNAKKDTRPSAKLSYARVSVQKACFVLDAIRGKDVQTALGIVTYNPRYASSLIEKLLKSAIANAENNNNMNVEGSPLQTASILIPAYSNGNSVSQWTRSSNREQYYRKFYISSSGELINPTSSTTSGVYVVPVFTLPATFKLSDSQIVA